MVSESGIHACARVTPITVWVVTNNESIRYLLENRMVSAYINLEMYQTTVVCSEKHFTCYIEGELHMNSILYDVQLLATHTLSAKCSTLNCDSSVHFGRANFADICVIMKLFLGLLQIKINGKKLRRFEVCMTSLSSKMLKLM